MNFYLSVAVLLVFGSTSFAGQNEVCNDLYKLTCAPGEYNDGTGIASNQTSSDNSMLDMQKKFVSIAHSRFKAEIVKPNNSYFRKIVLSATGLSLAPQCNGASERPSQKCIEDMATGATDLFFKQQLEIPQTGPDRAAGGSLSDKTYLTDSPIFNDVSKDILRQSKILLKTDVVGAKVGEKVFPQVKSLLIAKLEDLPIAPEQRTQMIEKIRAIRFNSSDCSEGKTETLPGLMTHNAYYTPNRNSFNYCSGLALQNKSEFQTAFVVAHELSHSIDPCGITLGPSDFAFKYPPTARSVFDAQTDYPIKNVLACLRSDRSAGAKIIYQAEERSDTAIGNESKNPKPYDFCENDQIGEAFADWMAAEIIPNYVKKNFSKLSTEQIRLGYSNVFRGFCQDSSIYTGSYDKHPRTMIRTNHTILAQPKIREEMGCPKNPPSSVTYCDPNAKPTPPPGMRPDVQAVVDAAKKLERKAKQ